jgi:hypothetical protein
MLKKRGGIAVLLGLVVVASIAIASTGSIINELYPSSVAQITRVQKNISIVRIDLAQEELADLRAIVPTVSKVFSDELPRQVDLLADLMKKQIQGKVFNLDTLDSGGREELIAAILLAAPEGEEIENSITDERISDAIISAGYRVISGGKAFVEVLASADESQGLEEERARLLLEFARFDMLTSYFIILVERSGA